MKERFAMFTALINKISRNIRRIKNREMAEYELRSTHASCLYHLNIAEPLTATELCERCEEDKATISRAVDYLEAEGYVICEPKDAKRYNSPILLTEKGRRVGEAIGDKVNRILDEVGTELSEQEREVFYRCLTIISDHLERATKS